MMFSVYVTLTGVTVTESAAVSASLGLSAQWLKHIANPMLFLTRFFAAPASSIYKEIRIKQIKRWSRDNPGLLFYTAPQIRQVIKWHCTGSKSSVKVN